MNRNYAIIAVVAVVAVVAVAGVFASGIFNQPTDNTVVKYTVVAPKDQKTQLQQGAIDGGVSWEPYVSDSLTAGTGHALIWSGDYWPNHPCCVIAVDKTWAAANEDTVKRILKAHVEATEWIQTTLENPGSENYTLLMNLGAEFSNRDVSVVENATEHMDMVYDITDESRNYLANFTQGYIDLNQVSANALSQRGYSSVDDFVNQYVNTEYLNDTDDVQPSDTIVATVPIGYLAGDLHQFARVVAESDELPGYEGKSIFEKYGIQTTTPQAGGYANGGAVMDAFNLGLIKVGYLGSPPAILRHLNNGINTEIVSLVNTEGSAIVVEDGINSIADLGGKTIATPGESSIQHLMLLSVAKENGLKVQRG